MALRGFLNAWLTVILLGLLLIVAFVYVMIRWVVPWLDTSHVSHGVRWYLIAAALIARRIR